MDKKGNFTRGEEMVMEQTLKATLLRAADIIDHITDAEVRAAQLELYREGVPLLQVSRVDRAMIASAHLRACVVQGEKAQATTADVRRLLEVRHG